MGNKANPLTGVFATRSPVRPNPIALFSCKVVAIEGRLIHVESIDAFDGSPILDIKPYIPSIDSISQAKGPKFIKPFSQEDEPLGGSS
jgi:tRNA-Thr(GGU) m(6)t(6)A37 methyltransferase TsaA